MEVADSRGRPASRLLEVSPFCPGILLDKFWCQKDHAGKELAEMCVCLPCGWGCLLFPSLRLPAADVIS